MNEYVDRRYGISLHYRVLEYLYIEPPISPHILFLVIVQLYELLKEYE